MIHGGETLNARNVPKRILVLRFVLAGATVGLLVGLYEAALLYTTPRIPTLLQPDVCYVIWFLAPLAALLYFALLGTVLGMAAVAAKRPRAWSITIPAAVGVGLAAFYVALVAGLSQVWVSDRISLRNLALPSASFLVVFPSALVILRVWQSRGARFLDAESSLTVGPWTTMLFAAASVCGLAIGLYAARRPAAQVSAATPALQPNHGPNFVLIVLDTVRADHLSAYGYPRPTTPNLARLARQGTLFENAVSPSSWTLPCVASIFCGLLPHQHGADWAVPLDTSPKTLAEILGMRGYETAGFNGNPAYGLAGWGIAQGFEVYEDDGSSLRHNLAATVAGRTLVQPSYDRLVHFDSFDRRDARELNRDVFRWFGRRSSRPFFLFINYFDAHYPYLPPPPYNQRFGKISEALIQRAVKFEYRGNVPKPPAEEQESLVTAYDNSLAYLDDQVRSLLQFLARSPEWSNTFVIITSDHGEAFGEHGSYGHGLDLYREVLHVPLILVGPGIPAGRRIASLAPIRELFPTVLDLVFGEGLPFSRSSLRRFWTPNSPVTAFDGVATSELIPVISLTTSEWHYLYYVDGRTELFHWSKDPQEETNLSEAPQYQQTCRALHQRLEERVRLSFEPWRGPEYLLAITRSGQPPLAGTGSSGKARLPSSREENRVGASQAVFTPDAASKRPRPLPADQDLMNSLPYH